MLRNITATLLRVATILLALTYAWLQVGYATTFDVGVGQSYSTIGSVPFYKLAAGDVVNIHAISGGGCYAEKFLVSTQGTSWSNPITVQGVNDPTSGAQACVTGLKATQSKNMKDHWSGSASAQYSESLYVVGISLQAGLNYGPAYVVLNNLEITGAAEGANYTADDGSKQQYGEGVAAIRIINSSHVKIENCFVHGIGGNGIFGKPNNSYPGTMADIQLYYNHIAANGVSGNYLYHNSYLEADQSTYIGNLFEPEVNGAPGSHLKDRSAGTVVAYNYFHGSAARYIDMVEPQDGWQDFGGASYYGSDFVYGNIFEASANDQNFNQVGTMVHYGGDQGASQYYRDKTLNFYDNTLVVTANSGDAYKLAILEPDVRSANVVLTNNLLNFSPRTNGNYAPELDIVANNNGSPTGMISFGANWISPGWQICFQGGSCLDGTEIGQSNVISPANNNPGFVSVSSGNYNLGSGSSAIGVASPLPFLITSNPQGGNFTPTQEYVNTPRTSLADLGAYAYSIGGTCTYSTTPTVSSISGGAYSSSLALTTQAGCAWTAKSSNSAWLKVSPLSGSGSANLTMAATANPMTHSREATITSAGQKINVTQASQ